MPIRQYHLQPILMVRVLFDTARGWAKVHIGCKVGELAFPWPL